LIWYQQLLIERGRERGIKNDREGERRIGREKE